MRKYLAGGAAVGLLVAMMGASASAQEKKNTSAPLPAKKTTRPDEGADPTQPGPKLQERLTPILPGTAGTAAAATVFTINVRGRVITTDQTPAVLLELEPQGQPTLVISGGYFGYGGQKLKLVKVTATEVVIDIGSGKELYLR